MNCTPLSPLGPTRNILVVTQRTVSRGYSKGAAEEARTTLLCSEVILLEVEPCIIARMNATWCGFTRNCWAEGDVVFLDPLRTT